MTIHYYVLTVNMLLVYHNLPFSGVLYGKCWYGMRLQQRSL